MKINKKCCGFGLLVGIGHATLVKKNRVADPDLDWIRIQLLFRSRLRIRIPENELFKKVLN
jgi:hypothetical protein